MTETTKRILNLQKQNGVNDHQLELGANLAVSSIQAWKKGKKRKDGSMAETTPSTEAITNLSRYFNVSADYLLCLTDEPTPLKQVEIAERSNALSPVLAELSQDEDFVNSAKLYKAVDKEYKSKICAYILGMAEALGVNIA